MKKEQHEIVRKVYEAQKRDNDNKFDWFQAVEKDKKYYKINLSDYEIREMSKFTYKRLVMKQIHMKSLFEIQESNKSKVQNILKFIRPDKNFKIRMQPYLKSEVITTCMKQQLFSLRNRSYNLKCNYKSLYDNDMTC